MSILLFLHANYHVQYIESIKHYFKVLILQELHEEVKEGFTFGHYILRIRCNFLSYILEHFIDGFGSDSPVILGVHHSRYLISCNEFTVLLGVILTLTACVRKANVTHACEHLILGLFWRFDWSF